VPPGPGLRYAVHFANRALASRRRRPLGSNVRSLVQVRMLGPSDAEAFQRLRLQGLKECPSAFASSYEEELHTPLSAVEQRLSFEEGRAVFGACADGELLGLVGLQREPMRKLSHKAVLWGMYVAPQARRSGVGRALVVHALSFAAESLRVRQVILGVNANNSAALRLYAALGFTQFGCEQGFMFLEGELHNEIQMVCFLVAGAVLGDPMEIPGVP
jgi:ribosomal protein S18 acetylase RimI-like enzyme